MDNTTVSTSAGAGAWSFPQDSILFLTILLLTSALKLLLTAAVIAERNTNCTVRLILVSLLLSSVISSVPSALYDIFGIAGGVASVRLSTDQVRLSYAIGTMIFYFGGTAHVLSATMYSVTIFIQIKFWDEPILQPRNNKYFILAAVCVWTVAFISASPLVFTYFEATPASFCNCFFYLIIIVVLHSLAFSILPAVLSLVILLVTVRYYKRHTLVQGECNNKGLKRLINFGFFLLALQMVHFATHVLFPIMLVNIINRLFDDTYFSARSVFDGIHLSLIPTPLLILIFFKPSRDTLTRWLTCRFRSRRSQKCAQSAGTVPV